MTTIFRLLVASLAVSAVACSSEPPTTSSSEGAVKTPPVASTAAPAPTTPVPVATGTVPTPVPTGTVPPTGGACAPQANDPCEMCLVQKCCAQLTAYEADPQSQAFDTCAQGCQQAQSEQQWQQCMQTCATQSPSAAQKGQAIDTCVQQGCATQCQQ